MFRWLGEHLAVDLANTVMVVRDGETVDLLASPGDLRLWLEAERSRLGELSFPAQDLEDIRVVRDAVRDLLAAAARGKAPPPEALRLINAASAAAPVALQLQVGHGTNLRTAEISPGGPRLTRLLGTLARSAIALVTSTEREQLRVCNAPSCGMFFIGARRWCCAACGNRARAARHYRRARSSPSAASPA